MCRGVASLAGGGRSVVCYGTDVREGSAMDEPMREQAAVLALVRASPGEWYQTADVICEAGSALRLLGGEPVIMPAERAQYARELVSRVSPADVSHAQALIEHVTSR